MDTQKTIRAAIYTRKSSEEGLEQDFNSLDAQREACESYIKSQKHEGWVLVEKEYSDGGISGGTLNRPAIQKLLTDIKNGEVDMIVVYKIDRLTRSLNDFSKLVEIFDKHQASFVSITQQFNTSTSMGRLTLNMLLSFAQFEREVTGERVRDKKLASAKKGIWTNGYPPYGYEKKDKKVVIHPINAPIVKMMYDKYLELGSVPKLFKFLKLNNYKTRTNQHWTHGALYKLLSHPFYIGKLPYKGDIYEGLHEGIIPKDTFRKVQELLANNRNDHKVKVRAKDKSILAGLLYDDNGNRFYPIHSTKKNNVRYRYYQNKAMSKKQYEKLGSISQIPAQIIESTIQKHINQILSQVDISLCPIEEQQILNQFIQSFKLENHCIRSIYLAMIYKIIITPNNIEIQHQPLLPIIQSLAYSKELPTPTEETISYNIPAKLSISKSGARIFIGETLHTSRDSQNILDSVKKGFLYNDLLLKGTYKNLEELCEDRNLDRRQSSRLLNLRFLSPTILERIYSKNIPAHWTTIGLMEASLITNWEKQCESLN